MIYPKDHLPPHVHVIGPDCEAKFLLENLSCTFSRGFSFKALREISVFLSNHKAKLVESWNEQQK